MSSTILLIRHAAHGLVNKVLCGRTPGVTLSDCGRRDAAHLAERLAGQNIAGVYASPLERAQETAAPIAEACGLEVVVEPALNEIDFGAWTGRTFAELAEDLDWGPWNAARAAHRPPGGESMGEAQARVTGWIARMQAAHDGQTVVGISHGDVIKAALCDALGLSVSQHDRFEISPGGVSRLIAGDWGLKVHSLNEAAA